MIARQSASLFLLAAFLVLPFVRSYAQSQTTGRIVGTVVDQTGAVIVGAKVVVVSIETGDERTATTSGEGAYEVPRLAPGAYRVRVTANGFNEILFEAVQIVITETRTVPPAKLSVRGVITDAVVVRSVPLLHADGQQLGREVNSVAVTELPSATRNPTQLLDLSTGANANLPNSDALGRNSQDVSINGTRSTQNDLQINGVDANRIADNSAATLAVPAPESIMAVKIQTSLYDPSYGRAGGGNIQLVTKSGSNDLHGSVYGYLRDNSHSANNPFLKAAGVRKPLLDRNVFGSLLGGPIQRDRSFFFVLYQGTRERNGAADESLSSSVLVAPGLTDDRSVQRLLGTFPVISIHPAALALLNTKLPNGKFLIPTPQADGHYSGSAISSYREDQFNSNVDIRDSGSNHFAIKFFFSNAPQVKALSGANVPGFGTDEKQNNRLLSLQAIHIFSQNAIDEARVGYNFIRADRVSQNPVNDSDLGILRANANAYPGLGLIRIGPAGTGALTIGSSNGADQQNVTSSTTLANTLGLTRGRHSIQTGAEVILYREAIETNNNRRGQVTFQSFNNFLIGSASSSVYGSGILKRILSAGDYSFFFQDSWKISRKMVVNLGLRYELDLPAKDSSGRLGVFDPTLYEPRLEIDGSGNPIGPPIGGLVQAGNVIPQFDLKDVPNVGDRVIKSIDPNNFAPRLGFAYSASGNLAVRGGYGIYYSRTSLIHAGLTLNAPPMYATRRSPSSVPIDIANPYFPLPQENQFPTVVRGIALAGNTFDRNMRTPYIQQYNVSVQYSLANDLLFEAAYAGTRGLNLLRSVPINQARLASPQNPIVNEVTGNAITTNTPANTALRAPYQGVEVGGGFLQIQSTAQSTYNSLQASLTKSLSTGLQFLASYTYSKSLDNSSGGDGVDTVPVLANALDNRSNRGVSNFDVTHRFVFSYVWRLPRPAFAASSTLGRSLLSNWQLAGITTVKSGLPIDIVDGLAGSLYGLNGGNTALARPSWAPGATRKSATTNIPAGYFFNPAAFVRPFVAANETIPTSNGTAIAGVTGTDIGNLGRNVLRGPGQNNLDIAITRRFPLPESSSVEFRVEFFNMFNHVNSANPISNLNAAIVDAITGVVVAPGDFGRITSTSNNQRLIQYSLKFNF